MSPVSDQKDQQHPLWSNDRTIVDTLLVSEATDYNLAELARLRMRYQGFPGARDIQTDLDKVLQQWNLTEEALYTKTQALHFSTQIYRVQGRSKQEDWV